MKRNKNAYTNLLSANMPINTLMDNRKSESKLKSSKQIISFALQLENKIKFMSFSQRRFIGFRRRYEFDKKRLLLASNDELTVVGYDQLDRPYELFKGCLNDNYSSA